jgi:hypothetical protein
MRFFRSRQLQGKAAGAAQINNLWMAKRCELYFKKRNEVRGG